MSKTKLGRNDLCLCGSGKKYKKCCMEQPQATPQDQHSHSHHHEHDGDDEHGHVHGEHCNH